jgi:hypothetical protein
VVLLGTNGNGIDADEEHHRDSASDRGQIEVEIDGERHDLIGRSTEDRRPRDCWYRKAPAVSPADRARKPSAWRVP